MIDCSISGLGVFASEHHFTPAAKPRRAVGIVPLAERFGSQVWREVG